MSILMSISGFPLRVNELNISHLLANGLSLTVATR